MSNGKRPSVSGNVLASQRPELRSSDLNAPGSARENDTVLDTATRAAVIRHNAQFPDEPLSDEAIQRVQDGARSIIADEGHNMAETFHHAKLLTESMGMPSARNVLCNLVTQGTLSVGRRRGLLRQIESVFTVKDVGCARVDFHDSIEDCPNVAYMRLDSCPTCHDLGAQLDKLFSRLGENSDAKKQEILKHLSGLIFLGRATYASVVTNNRAMVNKICKGVPPAVAKAAMETLRVDPTNTTLYLTPDWGHRIGIFISLETSSAEELNPSESGTEKCAL